MKNTARFHPAYLAAAATLALAACGGGDNDNEPPANVPPASASATSQGFLDYIASFAQGMFDNAEPVDLSMFEAPTDNVDNQEPAATPADAT